MLYFRPFPREKYKRDGDVKYVQTFQVKTYSKYKKAGKTQQCQCQKLTQAQKLMAWKNDMAETQNDSIFGPSESKNLSFWEISARKVVRQYKAYFLNKWYRICFDIACGETYEILTYIFWVDTVCYISKLT